MKKPRVDDSMNPPSQHLQQQQLDPPNVKELYHLDTTQKLGEGAFSVVIKATKKATGEEYAMKIYNRSQLNDRDLQGLRQEIQILKQVQSDYIIGLDDVLGDRKYIYLATELMSGGDLFERIAQKKFYVENDARDVSRRLLEAVAHCHSRNIVHRDLKPENLLLSSDQNDSDLKVGDFGFATLATSNEALVTKCGTPTYVAPEILLGKRYGRTVDMWSLGVITYILLGGYPPFADKDTKNMYRKICTAQFQFHKKYWNQVSDLAKDFISKLLVVEPTERLTAEQALEHPWFSSNESFMSVENLTDNLEKLRVFNLKRKVRAAVYAVIATNKLTSLGFFSHSMEIDTKP